MATISASAFRRVLATNAKGIERTGQRIFHSTQRPWCSAPIPRALRAHQPKRGSATESGKPYHLDIHVPCRKCDKCLTIRRLDWRSRIMSELRSCPKNWFVTLTFRPESRKQFLTKAGVLRPLPDRTRIAMEGVASYLKRVRDHAGLLRFFVVTEMHKDGFPHMHMLLHSYEGATKAQIEKAKWPHGFVKAKLCDEETGKYLVKYLTKEHNRVRASLKYGSPPLAGATEMHPSDAVSERDQTLPLVGNEGYDLENNTARQGVSAQGMARGLVLPPEEIVRAMMYNREIDLNDGVAVLSTLFELGSESVEDSSNGIIEETGRDSSSVPDTVSERSRASSGTLVQEAPPPESVPGSGAKASKEAAAKHGVRASPKPVRTDSKAGRGKGPRRLPRLSTDD